MAYAAAGRGERSAYRASTFIDAQVAKELFAGSTETEVVAPPRSLLLRHRLSAIGRRQEQQLPPLDGLPRGAICFVVHNAKFLRFAEPVIRLAGPSLVLTRGRAPGQPVVELPALAPVNAWRASLQGNEVLPAAYDQFHRVFERVAPSAVVMVEGNHPFDGAANAAARRLGIPTVCVQHGWSPIVHNGFRRLEFDRMVVWGDGFRRLLEPFSPTQEFVVTGNPALVGREAGADERLRELLAGRSAVGFYLQSRSMLITSDHLRRMEELILSLATDRPDVAILVREHPSWPLDPATEARLEAAPNVFRVAPSEFPLGSVIAATSATVSIYSTTLLESVALGVVPIVFNPTSLPRYSPDLERLGAGVEVESASSAKDTIERILDDPSYRESFRPGLDRVRDDFFAGVPPDAAERMAGVVADVAAGGRIAPDAKRRPTKGRNVPAKRSGSTDRRQ